MDARFRIRPATIADVPALVAVERACFSDPWSAHSITEVVQVATSRAFLAEGSGEIVGYLLARISGPEGEILDLAVLPRARRRGIARSLLDVASAALAEAGVEHVFLEVRESNRAALALYAAAGYRTIGMRRHYYRNPPEDALVLRTALVPRGNSDR